MPMIQPHRSLSLPKVLLICCMLGVGCVSRPGGEPVRSTPAAPPWRADEVARTLRTLASAEAVLERTAQTPNAGPRAERVADYLAHRLHDIGVQPGAAGYRIHFWPSQTADRALAERPLVLGLVAGRDPFAASDAVIVYTTLQPGQTDRVSPAAWLEMARVYAELGRNYRFPAPTLIFMMAVGGRPADALNAYRRRPIWPLGHVRAVLTLGAESPEEAIWKAAGIPDSVQVQHLSVASTTVENGALAARALAQQGYAWLLPYTAGEPASTMH